MRPCLWWEKPFKRGGSFTFDDGTIFLQEWSLLLIALTVRLFGFGDTFSHENGTFVEQKNHSIFQRNKTASPAAF